MTALPRARSALSLVSRLVRAAARPFSRTTEASRRLAEVEERLRLALSGARAGFWEVDLAAPALRCDESFRALYGFPPNEPEDRARWRDRIHPEDLPRLQSELDEALAGDVTAWNREFRILHPTEGERWIHDRVRVRRDGRGRPVAYGGLHFDFTPRKRMEDALRERETRLRLAQTAARIASWDWNVATGAVAWLGPMQALLGLDADHPPSTEVFMGMIHPEDRADVDAALAATLAGGGALDTEFRIVRRDGAVRWLAGRAEVVRDATGAPTRMLGVNYDVTARKEAEAALARLNADLERRVQEGAAKVAHLQKMDGLGRLTGGIAHDFNNLLAVVMGNLEALQARLAGDERSAQLVASALRGTERGAALTGRLLAFARRQELNPAPVDVPALVRGMSDLLSRSLGPGIRVETRFAEALDPALVDAGQLELALLNLAVNARDAMPDGGRLVFAVDAVEAGGDGALPAGSYIRIQAIDAGMGMDAETLAQAAEPFFTTKAVGKGTGLGLSIVHGLAAQSGGAFSLRSAPGEGTTAEILLPRARAGAPVPLAPAPFERAPPGLRVLVVDDDPLVLAGTARMLEALGHRPLPVGSGFEALSCLRSGQALDAVITDEVMPGLRGLQLAALAARERPDVPVILATGFADIPDSAGRIVAARLDKPFGLPAIETALARATAAPARLPARTASGA